LGSRFSTRGSARSAAGLASRWFCLQSHFIPPPGPPGEPGGYAQRGPCGPPSRPERRRRAASRVADRSVSEGSDGPTRRQAVEARRQPAGRSRVPAGHPTAGATCSASGTTRQRPPRGRCPSAGGPPPVRPPPVGFALSAARSRLPAARQRRGMEERSDDTAQENSSRRDRPQRSGGLARRVPLGADTHNGAINDVPKRIYKSSPKSPGSFRTL
jgi:hypothetical protein